MPLPRPSGPRVLWQDLRAFWAHRPRHQWVAATLALLIPMAIIVIFYFDGRTNIAPGEQVIFVDSWPASRTDQEIRVKQKADLARRQAAEAERRRQFQRLEEGMNKIDRLGF